MGIPSMSGRAAREEREKLLILKHKFENRITVAKFGKESLDIGDYSNAIAKFIEYMQIMAEVKRTKDFYALRPAHFDPKIDLTEMLMISHVFFEMARIYDAVPKFADESKKCLDQFVVFSVNQPYQVVNSEMIRKYLKKSIFKNQDMFRGAYQQIYVQSKKCYVVTFCYGEDHSVTKDFRELKDVLLESAGGRELVRIYYNLSSRIVPGWEDNRAMHFVAGLFLKPLLLFLSKTIVPLIIKKC